MRLVSWNVNGIRAALRNGFAESMHRESPDVICLQETKAQEGQVDIPLTGYHVYWHSAKKRGYSGTAVLTRRKPLEVATGLEELDDEGRVLTLEFPEYYLCNVYTPNAKRDLSRLDFRCRQWDPAFLRHLQRLEEKKPVVFCGDLNVAHTELDLANPKANRKNAGFTPEERASFDRIVEAGFVDTFRLFEKSAGHYSWWTWRNNARERNIGWRIDYFGASGALKPAIQSSRILHHVHGSDHCPVELELGL